MAELEVLKYLRSFLHWRLDICLHSMPAGELAHRAHRDLPPECSHFIHALPELMNQAATNYNLTNISFESLDRNTVNHSVALGSSLSNPLINLQLSASIFNLDDKPKRDSTSSIGDATDRNSMLFDPQQNATHNSSTNLFSKLLLSDLTPTNPYNIPTHTNITNNSTSSLTQSQRKARALLAINSLLKLSKGRLNPPLLPPKHSLYLAHLMNSLPHTGGSNISPGGYAESPSMGGGDVVGLMYLKKKLVVSSTNDMSKMSKVLLHFIYAGLVTKI